MTVGTGAAGQRTVTIKPGNKRDGILFRTVEQKGRLSVIPSDAASGIMSGQLDSQLFDITALLKQEYDQRHVEALPLIVSHSDLDAPVVKRLKGLAEQDTSPRRLDSINAVSFKVEDSDLGAFWNRLTADGSQTGARSQDRVQVWLDRRVRTTLDRSTAQIGAPAAWQAGLHGESVKVAVLDTGVDGTHPDLAGRIVESQDFSGSSGTGDVFGHGTHVAATVAGSGAASEGLRRGVAPAADLLIGKVLGDDGYGSASQVIAGMEWAAERGAKVVNMSLGSDEPSDGTDPMSQALNALSRSTDTLFVVAAGNTGELGTSTVGTPGVADAALTVGAVDRDDSLASFSSRGPRLGDKAVKPDVTAPGVNIVAARAAGTTMGNPVDEHYTAASGTSMATPHIAGVAALVSQRHPDWGPEQLKDAVVSTARTIAGQQVTEQGGGRVDAAAAALGAVTATGTLTLGTFVEAKAGPRTTQLRYSNSSERAVTLSLDLQLATKGGREPAPGAVELGTQTLQVPAGATVEVPLTVNPARLQRGTYYGYVTATSPDGKTRVHTTLSLGMKGAVHRLSVTSLGLDGQPISALPLIWGADGFVPYTDWQHGMVDLEEGTYQLDLAFASPDGSSVRHVILPEVKMTSDRAVTLDLRKTTKVDIRTPRPSEQQSRIDYQVHRTIDGASLTQHLTLFNEPEPLYVSPTAKVTEGTFEFASRWRLAAPLIEARVSGSSIALSPYYETHSPLFKEQGERLTAVDAGDAASPRFDHARGKLAVMTNREQTNPPDVLEKASKAGVRAVAFAYFSNQPWTRWQPDGERWAVPAVRLSADQGRELLTRIRSHATTVLFTGTARSPYLYDVMQVAKQQIPEQVVHTVTEKNTAVVTSAYADPGGAPWAAEHRSARRPYQYWEVNMFPRFVPTGFKRTEYVTAGDTIWTHQVHHETFDWDRELGIGMRQDARTYRVGENVDETWYGAVVRPSIPRGGNITSVRDGNLLMLRIPEFTDSATGHWARKLEPGWGGGIGLTTPSDDQQVDSAKAVLYRNGKEIATANSAWTNIGVPAAGADYRLHLSTRRTSSEWEYGTKTETSWSFTSEAAGAVTVLPLLQVDYSVPTDIHNQVGPGRKHTLGLTVRAQAGLSAPRGVKVKVEASYDDGRTWSHAPTRADGPNKFDATIHRPADAPRAAYVTLRVTANDAANSTVRQTITRAYVHRS
ncbi:S8 family serine peptidase [Streptomyces sp. T12]|uniref:S8 family serine peptidase n=1 Tax=Streptomyces sp. T12 TaxID=477697 RepID=UPI0021BDC748|nr:S8 family serine peptidase [Streptomyces sp. T12]